jgi:hypothetical protein
VPVVSGPTDSLPCPDFDPVQPLEAVQDVALLADQLRVALVPEVTEAGVALIITTGAGVFPTVTVALLDVVPPPPVHDSVYVDVVVRGPMDLLPEVACAPDHDPEAVQLEAFVVVHVSCEVPFV